MLLKPLLNSNAVDDRSPTVDPGCVSMNRTSRTGGGSGSQAGPGPEPGPQMDRTLPESFSNFLRVLAGRDEKGDKVVSAREEGIVGHTHNGPTGSAPLLQPDNTDIFKYYWNS